MSSLEKIYNIKDKCIVVTGACGYFGSYMVESLLELGAKVIMLSHSSKKLYERTKDFEHKYNEGKVWGYEIDFYKRDEAAERLCLIERTHKIDVIINNAYDMSIKTGFDIAAGYLENYTAIKMEYSLQSGVFWAFLTTQIIGKQFVRSHEGSIINISSMYSEIAPNPDLYEGTEYFNPVGYSISKAALDALTRYTASFWGKYGIRCNSVLPGPFPKEIFEEFLEKLKERTVLNRVGELEDLIGIIVYLASDASKFMTGQSIKIDGGWTIT